MPVTPGEPLTKVTLNLYTEDLEVFRRILGYGWTSEVREAIHAYALKLQGRGGSNVYGG